MTTTMADLAPLRHMNDTIRKQSTFRLRFEDNLDRVRISGRVADGVVLPEGPCCYVAERRQRSEVEDESGMYWHIVYANAEQMAVVKWVLTSLPKKDAEK